MSTNYVPYIYINQVKGQVNS